MPIGFDPQDVLRIHLDCLDKDKPAVERAVFLCRVLTAGQVKQMERLRRAALEAPADDQADELINRALLVALAGWENLRDARGEAIAWPGDDQPQITEVLDRFTPRLKFAMAAELPIAAMIGEAQLFRSGSPSPAGTASSAPAAPAAPPAAAKSPV